MPRIEADEFCTIEELAEAVGLAERHISHQLRLAYLAPEVLKRLTCTGGRPQRSVCTICVFWRGMLGENRSRRRSGLT